ncbi:MAG: hypothetical protein F7B20_00720 [Aeropyrum sp.]|nr:hypothetical protein [Aeropyrum sp.]MCE4615896.1 hypothetical protein [Aeropyrum sp.]
MSQLPSRIRGFIEEFKRLVSIHPDTPGVARRMFVTNGFDGLLAAIGVNVGGFRGEVDPLFMVLSIMGGALSMGILSGVVGVYLSERAERLKEVARLERKVARSLRGSIYWRAANFIPLYIALWSGVGILAFPFLTVTPYIAAMYGLVSVGWAFWASIAIALALSAGLGYYLGVVSGESRLLYTVRGLALSVAAILLVAVFKTVLGAPPIG